MESQHEAKTDYVAPHPLVYFGAIVRSDDDGEDSRFSPVNDVQLDTEYGELFFTSSEQDDDVESQNDEDDF